MATDEQRFAIGLAVSAAAITVLVFLFNLIDFEDDADQPPAPIISSVPSRDRPSGDTAIQPVSHGSVAAPAEAGADVSTESDSKVAQADRSDTRTPAGDEVASHETPVIDPVPFAYFEPDSNALHLPTVLEKYLDRVERGTRFMARLEDIVADRAADDPVGEPGALALSFTSRSVTKRLSYNVTHTTRWLEAAFTQGGAPDTADVLVDVRRGGGATASAERVALFFASVQSEEGAPRFALALDGVEGELRVHVYALTDALPSLGSALLQLDDVRE